MVPNCEKIAFNDLVNSVRKQSINLSHYNNRLIPTSFFNFFIKISNINRIVWFDIGCLSHVFESLFWIKSDKKKKFLKQNTVSIKKKTQCFKTLQ